MNRKSGTNIVLAPEVIEVLQKSTTDGVALVLPADLDRKLYVAVNQALEALGGKWNRGRRAHIFKTEVKPLIDQATGAGQVLDAKKHFQFFETPDALAARLVSLAGKLKPGTIALEPSAGHGAIARHIKNVAQIDLVEVDPAKVELLQATFPQEGIRIAECDFLKWAPPYSYDYVFMNPPFTRDQDIKHINHAFRLLKPGGVICAILSARYLTVDNRETKAFRALLATRLASTVVLPAGTFRDSGTDIATVLLKLGKPRL